MTHQLPSGTHRLHGNGIMFRGITDHYTKLTALTTVNDYFGYHLTYIKIEGVGLRAI